MEVRIISIGNSKGIRIPKALLAQCHITNRVKLVADGKQLIIKPLRDKPREGWQNKFKAMALNKDDQLLISDRVELDGEEWEW